MKTEENIKKDYLTLPMRPIWEIIKEAQPERREVVALRVKDLLEQREAIDLELEMLGYRTGNQPVKKAFTQSEILPKWQYSLIGYHGIVRNKKFTPEKFYKFCLNKMSIKHSPHYDYVSSHKDEVIAFIKSRFAGSLILTLLFVTFVPR